MPTRLPTLVKRPSRPPSSATVDAANAPSAEETSPASAVVTKPVSVLTRFGTTFFNRKTMAVTKHEVVATATPLRPQRAALVGSRPQIIRRGSTETDLSASLPAGDMARYLQRKSSRNVLQKANSTLSAIVAALPAQLKPQISSVDEALISGAKDSETRVPDETESAVEESNPSAALIPHRPPAEQEPGEQAPEEQYNDVVPRRPILSKRMSASHSTIPPTQSGMPHQKSASFRNLLHFDRSKTGLGPSASATLPQASQKSVNSMRDSGDDSSEIQQLAGQYVLENCGHELTTYEKQEITKFNDVFYYASIAIKSRRHNGKIIDPPVVEPTAEASAADAAAPLTVSANPTDALKPSRVELFNDGYDDEHGDYVMLMQDHLGYRYEVLHPLGAGSFGQVVCCVDHATKTKVAVKVIRNRKKYKEQAMIEIQVLTQLQEQPRAGEDGKRRASRSYVPPSSPFNVIQMIDSFVFRNHLCITFELLGMNLYEYLKLRFFQGMPMDNIRVVTRQLLHALAHLRTKHIVHCDMKPENVLIKTPLQCFGAGPGRSSVAYANVPIENVCLIDFGSSCLDSATLYTYIQSRFYRSPEVILGYPYGTPIDMWSLGCIVVELYTGHPIFAGENETEQLMCMMEILGIPPTAYLAKSKRRRYFFQEVPVGDPSVPPAVRNAAATAAPPVDGATLPATAPATTTTTVGVIYRPLAFTNSRGRRRVPGLRDLVSAVKSDDEDFISFIRKCFLWDPNERLTPEDALREPWLTKETTTPAEG